MNSAQFAKHFDKRLRISFDNGMVDAEKYSVYSRIFLVEDTNEYTQGYTSTEGMELPEWITAESGPLKNSKIGEGYEKSITSREFGHKLVIPYQMRLKAKDNTVLMEKVVTRAKNKAITAALSFIEIQSHEMLNDGFAGDTYTAPDSVAVFGDHTWNSTGSSWTNKSASNTAMGVSAIDELEKYAGAFTDSEGTPMTLDFDTIIVKKGSTASRSAIKTLASDIVPDQVANVNIYMGGQYTIIETPYIQNVESSSGAGDNVQDTAWFAMDSKLMEENALKVAFVDRPHLEDMIVQENIDWFYPIIGSMQIGVVNMPFMWYGSTGAGASYGSPGGGA